MEIELSGVINWRGRYAAYGEKRLDSVDNRDSEDFTDHNTTQLTLTTKRLS